MNNLRNTDAMDTKKCGGCLHKRNTRKMSWVGKPMQRGPFQYFSGVILDKEHYEVGDFVSVATGQQKPPKNIIGKIIKLWEDQHGLKWFHVTWLCQANDVVTGKDTNCRELFMTSECENTLLHLITKKVVVKYKPVDNTLGRKGFFFCQKWYDCSTGKLMELRDELSLTGEDCGFDKTKCNSNRIQWELSTICKRSCNICSTHAKWCRDCAIEDMTEITWQGPVTEEKGPFSYFSSFNLRGINYVIGDFVLVEPQKLHPVCWLIARIVNMWQDENGLKWFHATWFRQGKETILGEEGNPHEIYVTNECENTFINMIAWKATVYFFTGKKSPLSKSLSNSFYLGDGTIFFCQKEYDVVSQQFSDLRKDPPLLDPDIGSCNACSQSMINSRHVEQHDCYKAENELQFTKATTTPTISKLFASIFYKQIKQEDNLHEKDPHFELDRGASYLQSGCNRYKKCKRDSDYAENGASTTSEDDTDSESKYCESFRKRESLVDKTVLYHVQKTVRWKGECIAELGPYKYYRSAVIDGEVVCVNDCVLVDSNLPNTPLLIAKISFMWQDAKRVKWFHATWFCRGMDTVVGRAADPLELFVVDECENTRISLIKWKVVVHYRSVPKNWKELGGTKSSDDSELNDNGRTFFCQKRYDRENARFEDYLEEESTENTHFRNCNACERVKQREIFTTPVVDEEIPCSSREQVQYRVVRWKNTEYRVGSSVYLQPETFTLKSLCTTFFDKPENQKVNEDIYTEFYRKMEDGIKGSNEDTPEPFCIGLIVGIFLENNGNGGKDVKLRVKMFYRPENVFNDMEDVLRTDLNKLYWSDEECTIPFENVVGKCYVVYSNNLTIPVAKWSCEGPDRFYFTETFNSSTQTVGKLVPHGKASLLGKQLKDSQNSMNPREVKYWPDVNTKLRTLDIFAGCGGLSYGLQQSGVAEICWAIEKEESAAQAFSRNHPHCTVLMDDCNLLLQLVMNGAAQNSKQQPLPQRGEVDLICGGPPCQGFSGLNRYSQKLYSRFQNSLVASFLSYCDYYRPRFIIMENVRNFVSFKQSLVLNLTLRALLEIGYQCTFTVLQAGNFGVPQSRKRLILLAAAPGEALPSFPEPTHTFSQRACQLNVAVNGQTYYSNCNWIYSAPRRTITVRDALSDLPEIPNGHEKYEIKHKKRPLTHFQRLARGNEIHGRLRDHICKNLNPLNEARVANIPTNAGADWRDLPNIVLRLSDGSYTNKLIYTNYDPKSGQLRGVCPCAEGKECDPTYKQNNTLIPWSFVHTAYDHNNWQGRFGRVNWNGYFSTITTNPDPSGIQGRILHPEQLRVMSVREFARVQGFPDSFIFCGSLADKYRQVGNAVPPPLSAAIGHEIGWCLAGHCTE